MPAQQQAVDVGCKYRAAFLFMLVNQSIVMDFESNRQPDLLVGFSPTPKKLLTLKQFLIFGSVTITIMLIHMYAILSPLPTSQQDKIAFLAAFTIFIAAPIASIAFSLPLAFIPIKHQAYLPKLYFLSTLTLLIIEAILLTITLAGR
jgi:hypothetical protein